MGSSISLGRISGIEIDINWSWLIVFGLITWSLAENIFPSQNPGLSHHEYLVMAVVASLLFFTSLLLHELGHAFQARREGMQIEGITLWLFGGVAKFRGMFPSAGAEFRIAIAGPLVSLALGGFFVLAAWRLALPDAVDGVAAWLGYINLVLLVFNMLPALPLDGGRVLRAALWQARGSYDWATVVAANVGRAFGVLMIVGGIVLVLFRDAVSGIWLAFIGVFLWQAAGAELRFLVAREALGGLRVRDLMIRDPVTVGPELTVRQLMDVLAREGEHETYPVVRAGHLVGLLPLARIAQVPRSEWETATVGDCALSLDHVPLLRADDELIDALQEVGTADMQRGLVVEDGDRLVGLVSIEDLVRAVQTGIVRRGIRVRR